jgi:hypothetical protein
MKVRKRIAAVVLSFLAMLLAPKFASFHCATLNAWFPALGYDTVFVWLAPVLLALFLHSPAYDLVSLITYKLGLEPAFDQALVFFEGSSMPVSLRHKLFGYPSCC